MDTVTYPHPKVREALSRLVAVHYNTAQPDAETRRRMREARMLFTPTLIWFDHHGIEVRREVGYLEPRHLIGAQRLAEGMAALLHGQFAEALGHFLRVEEEAGDTAAAPEALYWAGVAALREGSREDFLGHWRRLHERFPDSHWWSRASFANV